MLTKRFELTTLSCFCLGALHHLHVTETQQILCACARAQTKQSSESLSWIFLWLLCLAMCALPDFGALCSCSGEWMRADPQCLQGLHMRTSGGRGCRSARAEADRGDARESGIRWRLRQLRPWRRLPLRLVPLPRAAVFPAGQEDRAADWIPRRGPVSVPKSSLQIDFAAETPPGPVRRCNTSNVTSMSAMRCDLSLIAGPICRLSIG